MKDSFILVILKRSFGLERKEKKVGIKVQSSNSPFNPPNRPTDQRNAR